VKRQAALLDALPANVALLDARGLIVSVNEAWRSFAAANGFEAHAHGVGLDYAALCERAAGMDAAEAPRVAIGIRAVLAGEARSFAIEYPCHSPTQQRWFAMTVTPVGEDPPEGAVVMHVNITERREATEALLASEREQRDLARQLELERTRLVAAQRVARVGSWETDLASMIAAWSDETHRIHGTDPAAFVATHASFLAIVHPDDRARVDTAFRDSFERRDTCTVEHRLLLPGDRVKFVESRWKMAFDDEGTPLRAVGTCQDITRRKQNELEIARANEDLRQSEIRIIRLNRVHAVRSGINSLIVRASGREELFKEACRIGIDAGGFLMAMIVVVDPVTNAIVPVATVGKDEALQDSIRDILSSPAGASTTMVARAIREKKAVVANDSRTDPQVLFGNRYAAFGVRSIGVLPLLVGDRAVGALAFYAGESEFFHDDELKLLTELAGDVGFAIDHIEKRELLDYLAYYDVLTGLANRKLLHERLEQNATTARSQGREFALMHIDVERFRTINDTLGRPAGDALIAALGRRLCDFTGDASLIAHVESDRFAVMVTEPGAEEDLAHLAERLYREVFDPPFRVADTELRVAAKMGIAMFPVDGDNADTLLHNAEAALENAKARGERYLFYADAMNARVAGRLSLENQLRQALEREEFVLHYQPKVDLATGKLTGAEALIRWNDPLTGLVPPLRFIAILEENGAHP
jgi:diguanylate cyclase (GGDEF)-like protein/PAS domain S-box-containing protein